eukprot:1157593-Pelagomonas_calceolata.AAC.2
MQCLQNRTRYCPATVGEGGPSVKAHECKVIGSHSFPTSLIQPSFLPTLAPGLPNPDRIPQVFNMLMDFDVFLQVFNVYRKFGQTHHRLFFLLAERLSYNDLLCQSPARIAGLAEAAHALEVRARSVVGMWTHSSMGGATMICSVRALRA